MKFTVDHAKRTRRLDESLQQANAVHPFRSQMNTNLFSGVFTALATPMHDGAIAYTDLEYLIDIN